MLFPVRRQNGHWALVEVNLWDRVGRHHYAMSWCACPLSPPPPPPSCPPPPPYLSVYLILYSIARRLSTSAQHVRYLDSLGRDGSDCCLNFARMIKDYLDDPCTWVCFACLHQSHHLPVPPIPFPALRCMPLPCLLGSGMPACLALPCPAEPAADAY